MVFFHWYQPVPCNRKDSLLPPLLIGAVTFFLFRRQGGTATTSLATTSSSSSLGLTAVGSDSGVVNVYDADTLEVSRSHPTLYRGGADFSELLA